MSQIKAITIPFNNLTEGEQIKLLFSLFEFSWDKLPPKKGLHVFIHQKRPKVKK